jgi:hypothetical protein
MNRQWLYQKLARLSVHMLGWQLRTAGDVPDVVAPRSDRLGVANAPEDGPFVNLPRKHEGKPFLEARVQPWNCAFLRLASINSTF